MKSLLKTVNQEYKSLYAYCKSLSEDLKRLRRHAEEDPFDPDSAVDISAGTIERLRLCVSVFNSFIRLRQLLILINSGRFEISASVKSDLVAEVAVLKRYIHD